MQPRTPIFSHEEMLRLFTQAAQKATEEARRLRKVEDHLREMAAHWDHAVPDAEATEGTECLSPARAILKRLSDRTR
jgi:hypothetical protein